MSLKLVPALAASAVLLGALAVAPSSTAVASTTAACSMAVGSITSGGDIANTKVTAGAPITATRSTGPHLFTPGIAKLASTWTTTIGVAGETDTYGKVILNSTLYNGSYGFDSTGKPTSSLVSQGGGYSGYIAIEQSFYLGATVRGAEYKLRGDGVLYRYDPNTRVVSRYAGYSNVKTMALISETATYDTFLVTTRAGVLYTLHIPANTTQKPVMKVVRSSTWQGFEFLVAEKCGQQGTLLAGIDKDTGSAYLYAVGHANGTATVIQGLGKVPGTFTDPVYYLHTAEGNPPLFGE